MNCKTYIELREIVDMIDNVVAQLKGIQYDRRLLGKETSEHLDNAITHIDDAIEFITDEIMEETESDRTSD